MFCIAHYQLNSVLLFAEYYGTVRDHKSQLSKRMHMKQHTVYVNACH